MDTIENIVDAINGMLEFQEKNTVEYLNLLDMLKAQIKLKFILIDLENYNEKRMFEYQQKKMEAANVRDFENAARYRTLQALKQSKKLFIC